MADAPLTNCPECETENALRKVLNSVGIVFKGSGFYVTDSRGKNGAAASANGKSSENGSSAKTESAAKENGSTADSTSANGSGKGKTEKTAV